ncbi:hypothetical protein EON66_04890 [archaeon]|nr:MAG: hypothetical protein EON66_04890 [archaeon]
MQWKKLKDTSLANATSVLKPAYGEAAALASTCPLSPVRRHVHALHTAAPTPSRACPPFHRVPLCAALKEQPWVSTGSSSEALRGRRANAVEVDLATMRVAQPLA